MPTYSFKANELYYHEKTDFKLLVCPRLLTSTLLSCSGQVVAYKALLAADTTVAQSKPHTKAKGLASGSYTLYWDSPAGIGTSTTDVTTTSFQSCLNACDADSECAAVAMAGVTTAMTTATGCQIIRGNNTVATFKRSVTKVNTNRLVLPTPSKLAAF